MTFSDLTCVRTLSDVHPTDEKILSFLFCTCSKLAPIFPCRTTTRSDDEETEIPATKIFIAAMN